MPVFTTMLISTFNMIFTACPIVCYAVVEQDLDPATVVGTSGGAGSGSGGGGGGDGKASRASGAAALSRGGHPEAYALTRTTNARKFFG